TLVYQPPHRVVIFARVKWIGIPTLNLASWSLDRTEGGVRVRLEQESRSLGLGLGRALNGRLTGWAVDRVLARLKADAAQAAGCRSSGCGLTRLSRCLSYVRLELTASNQLQSQPGTRHGIDGNPSRG